MVTQGEIGRTYAAKRETRSNTPEASSHETEQAATRVSQIEVDATKLSEAATARIEEIRTRFKDNAEMTTAAAALEAETEQVKKGLLSRIADIGRRIKSLFRKETPSIPVSEPETPSTETEPPSPQTETVTKEEQSNSTQRNKRKVINTGKGYVVTSRSHHSHTRHTSKASARPAPEHTSDEAWFAQGDEMSRTNESTQFISAVDEQVRQAQDITTADEVEHTRIKHEAAASKKSQAAENAKHPDGKAWVAGDKSLNKTYEGLSDAERDIVEELERFPIGDKRNDHIEDLATQGKITPDVLKHLKKRKDIKISKKVSEMVAMTARAATQDDVTLEDEHTYTAPLSEPKQDVDVEDGELLTGLGKHLHKRSKKAKVSPITTAPSEKPSETDSAFIKSLASLGAKERAAVLEERALEDSLTPTMLRAIQRRGWQIPAVESGAPLNSNEFGSEVDPTIFYSRLTGLSKEIADRLSTLDNAKQREELLTQYKGSPALTSYAKAAGLVSWDFDQDAFRITRQQQEQADDKARRTAEGRAAMRKHADELQAKFDAEDETLAQSNAPLKHSHTTPSAAHGGGKIDAASPDAASATRNAGGATQSSESSTTTQTHADRVAADTKARTAHVQRAKRIQNMAERIDRRAKILGTPVTAESLRKTLRESTERAKRSKENAAAERAALQKLEELADQRDAATPPKKNDQEAA